jgi:hypothetical protein
MTTLLQQIEALRVQVTELAGGEQKLLDGLSDALTRADHQLLHDVRKVATEHEQRRKMILKELQALALSMGAIPVQREPAPALEQMPHERPLYAEGQTVGSGDWRQATSKIQDELDAQLNGRTSTH